MEENKPKAKLINATIREPFYFSTYEYECIKCGKHYTRATYNSRISPYCGECSRERDRIANKARAQKKQNEMIIKERERIADLVSEYCEEHGIYDWGIIELIREGGNNG